MEGQRSWTRRLTWLVAVAIIWFLIGSSVFALATDDISGGAVGLVIVVLIVALLVEGRIIRLLEGRSLQTMALVYGAILVLLLAYFAIRDLQINELTLLDRIYVPGVVALVRDIGSLILATAISWELVVLWRR